MLKSSAALSMSVFTTSTLSPEPSAVTNPIRKSKSNAAAVLEHNTKSPNTSGVKSTPRAIQNFATPRSHRSTDDELFLDNPQVARLEGSIRDISDNEMQDVL